MAKKRTKTRDNEDEGRITEEEVEQWFEEEEDEEELPEDSNEPIEAKYAASQIRVVRSTIDFTLHTLKQSLNDPNYINISPEYQRRTRWDRKRRSQLIESFLMNIPVPPIFLFENQYNQYEAMDGRQRLETIRDFLDNNFALTGMEFFKELNGRRYNDLNATIQRGLLRRSITAIVLLAETTRPENSEHDVRMILFRRLNTGGARLNPQEMRNALYPGKFNRMLADTARSDLFTRIWRIPQQTPDENEKIPKELNRNAMYRNMADCELVLRFFAIRETIQNNLKGSIRSLLDKCMDRHSTDSQKHVDRLSEQFMTCLRILDETFDGDPFVLPQTGRLSRPLFDALMVALSLSPDRDPAAEKDGVQERLSDALSEPRKYNILIGRGNTVEAIKDRVELADEILG
ncbi:MAG: DUF262 domain-containing protein [bacterium]|nr:DUF262 domain-containing protein [bacterium]